MWRKSRKIIYKLEFDFIKCMTPLWTSNFFRDDFMTNVLFSISPIFFPPVFHMPIFCHVNMIYFKYMTMNSNQLFFPFGNLSGKILFPKYSRLLLLCSTLHRFITCSWHKKTNSPIHEFKVLQNVFKIKKQGLKYI